MKRKIVLTAMLLVFLSILPVAFAWTGTTSLVDGPRDLLIAVDIAHAPTNLQQKYSYLDITGASITCDSSTCTFSMTVTGTPAPAKLDPQIKYVRYVWRMIDTSGNLIRVYYDWSPSTGWFASDDAGIPPSSVQVTQHTLTITIDPSIVPANPDHWTARSWNSLLPGAGKCPVDLPATALGCPVYLWDGPNQNVPFPP